MNRNIYDRLTKAIHHGALEQVKRLINQFGLPQNNKNNYALFTFAVQENHTEIIKLLLSNGCSVYTKSKKLYKPLHLAIKNGNVEIIEILLKHGADINASDGYGRTSLHLTVQRENDNLLPDKVMEQILKMLLSRRANVNAQNFNDATVLHEAALRGLEKIVEILLEYNADVYAVAKSSQTPLHKAAEAGNEAIIKLLLNKGADIDAADDDGLTAFHTAIVSDQPNVVKLLLKCGANIINCKDLTPIHLAVKMDSPRSIEVLLELGADIESRDRDGKTPLHFAALYNSFNAVPILLENGSDINIVCKNNYTPLDYVFRLADYVLLFSPLNDNLKQHVIKMMCANLYICAENIAHSNNFNEANFLSECKEEIDTMKHEKIINNISFYDVLTKNINQLAVYARNENIVKVIKLADCKLKFPLYASMICNNFKRGMKRKELLEECHNILYFVLNGLPYNCTEKIYSYLSDNELRNLINACKL